jgi:hypothetical protein
LLKCLKLLRLASPRLDVIGEKYPKQEDLYGDSKPT